MKNYFLFCLVHHKYRVPITFNSVDVAVILFNCVQLRVYDCLETSKAGVLPQVLNLGLSYMICNGAIMHPLTEPHDLIGMTLLKAQS